MSNEQKRYQDNQHATAKRVAWASWFFSHQHKEYAFILRRMVAYHKSPAMADDLKTIVGNSELNERMLLMEIPQLEFCYVVM